MIHGNICTVLLSIATHNNSWLLAAIHYDQWQFMPFHEILCRWANMCDSQLRSMTIQENIWIMSIPVEVHDSLMPTNESWLPVAVYDNPRTMYESWLPVAIYDNPMPTNESWLPVAIHDDPMTMYESCLPMAIHDSPMRIHLWQSNLIAGWFLLYQSQPNRRTLLSSQSIRQGEMGVSFYMFYKLYFWCVPSEGCIFG